MNSSSLIVRTIAAILLLLLLLHVVNSNLTTRDDANPSDPLDTISDEIKWLRPLRVKRSAIVYNKCPTGYKRMPPPLMCVSCQQYQKITGESC